MYLHDPETLQRIEKAVAEAEKATSAEIVVVLAPQSGSYLDREMLFGVFAGLVALAFLVFSPWPFHPAMALADFMLVFGLATLGCNRFPTVKGMVVGRKRKDRNVRTASLVSFHVEGVGATRDRTGLLLFVSLFEGAMRFLPDFGIQGKLGEGSWNRIVSEAGALTPGTLGETVPKVVEEAGRVLGAAFPPGEENPDEIPNAPRVL